jgi:uncharacterized membrane protein
VKSRARILGHPIHPMLVVYPLGLLPVSLLFDILYLVRKNPQFSIVAYWTLLAGIIGALAAAIFGLIDFLAIPKGTRARSVGTRHGLLNVAAVVLFAVSFFLRMDRPESPEMTSVILSGIGVLIAAISAWLGGELPYRLGVGVDDGANLSAPSSLSGRPAAESPGRNP